MVNNENRLSEIDTYRILEKLDYFNERNDPIRINENAKNPNVWKKYDYFEFRKKIASKIHSVAMHSLRWGCIGTLGVTLVNAIHNGLIAPYIPSENLTFSELFFRDYKIFGIVVTSSLIGGSLIGLIKKDFQPNCFDFIKIKEFLSFQLKLMITGFSIGFISSPILSNQFEAYDAMNESFIITAGITTIVAGAGFELVKLYFKK